MRIIPARPTYIKQINLVIARSKSFWNYPQEYLDAAIPLIQVDQSYLSQNIAYEIVDESEETLGFFAMTDKNNEKYLDNLWIDTPYIGKGYGRLSFNYAENFALENEWKEILVLPDPPAEGFYRKLGFLETGKTVKSRIINGPIFSVFSKKLSS